MASELETALENMLKFCGPVVQRKIMRKIAGYMAKVNRKRMRTNVTPDGKAMQKRGGISSGMTFKEYMKTVWKRPKKKKSKSGQYAPPLKVYLSKIKRAKKKMFSRHEKENGKISRGMGSVLKETAESNSAEVAFTGAIGKTAQEHHYGRRVKAGKANFVLAVRELLGLPDADQKAIAEIIIKNMESYLSTGKLLSVRGN